MNDQGTVSNTKQHKHEELLLAYYGDDFTGSTDALEFLSNAGVKTLLFTDPPTKEQLRRYPGLQAVGVAGMTRSMTPGEMERTLRPAFAALRLLKARHVHYKVCSTFDSSPAVGSIGKAIELGREAFGGSFVPLLVAAPALGRYCVFGNLFARMGAGSAGEIFRLDRHPSMSRHPVTPADESDLRRHLSKQTTLKSGLLDILQWELDETKIQAALRAMVQEGSEIILLDGLYENQLGKAGALMDSCCTEGSSLFSTGSSGIEMALGSHWQKEGMVQPPAAWPAPGNAGPLLVASGSCSPVTAAQISHASAAGFEEIVVDIAVLHEDAAGSGYAQQAQAFLREGRSVVLHTGGNAGVKALPEVSRIYGTSLGTIIRSVAERGPVKRIVIAGGDTSGYAARAMGIEAVEMIAPLSPGAPLCRAYAPASPVDGLQVNFKGGQVGNPDYFEKAIKIN